MAGLFKNKIIKAKLETYVIPDFEQKLATVKGWLTAYQNKSLQQKTESQCEQAFNQAFFVDILGYKAFPAEIYTIDPKSHTEATGQKPDATLGWFTNTTKKVFGVVEIKDSKTPLDKSQHREGNLSPIQQAFKYKPQYKDCSFVIATNFFEIRLFKDNQLDYEIFTLETLADPKEEYFNFKKFYLLLCAENFIAEKGQSKTEKLLSEIRIEQEQITEKFYKEYKTLRLELINNILKNNAADKPLAVEKAQKIVDRIVFTCFCEDLDLLPQGKLQEVIYHTEKMGLAIPIWMILKGYFQAIDSGSAKLEIPNGYNGELFKPDPELENLKIDDEICLKFINLANYDFSDDLSVNILGHIFEQSITDLEELKQEDQQEKQVSKRKKDGIFYTPDYIVDYIVKNSLGKYLQEYEENILKKHGVKTEINDATYQKRLKAAYEEYQVVLRNVKILDPACGSGAFLVKVYDYLLAENKRIVSILTDLSGGKADLFNTENYIKFLLQNNIYGVDLNPESVEITKLSLWLKTAHKGEKLVNLKNNIKCGNSLINDPEVAGERAFKWEIEFEDIMKKGGFDVIVGNPPYGAIMKEREKVFLKSIFCSYEYQVNSYALFYEQGLNLLKNGGFLAFITPTTFTYQYYFNNLRKLFEKYQIEKIHKHAYEVFFDANIGDSVSWIMRKITNKKENIDLAVCKNISEETSYVPKSKKYEEIVQGDGAYNLNEDNFNLRNIYKNTKTLGDIARITVGIKPYQVGKGTPKQVEDTVKNKPYTSIYKKDDSYLSCINGKDFHRYGYIQEPKMYLSYGKWLAEPREGAPFFDSEKIIVRQTSDSLIAHYDSEKKINLNNVYNIGSNGSEFNLKYLLVLLNSRVLNYIYQTLAQEKGRLFAEVKKVNLEKLPIKNIDLDKQNIFIEKANQMLNLHKNFQEKIQKAIKLIRHEFQLEKINSKIERFYELDFNGFIEAIGIKKLDLQKKSELLDFFEKNKMELLNLNSQIEKGNDIIDTMVFDLYGLTSEERVIVLSAGI